MPSAQYPNRSYIRQDDKYYSEALDHLQAQINRIAQLTASSPVEPVGRPPAPSALSVTASTGIFDAQITDSNQISFGINYFLEWSLTPNFAQPHVIDLGASRNWRGALGGNNVNTYWRCYSQYWGSLQPSPITYFGTQINPTAVNSGASTALAFQPSTGSGTAKGDGSQGGSGLGRVISRSRGVALVE